MVCINTQPTISLFYSDEGRTREVSASFSLRGGNLTNYQLVLGLHMIKFISPGLKSGFPTIAFLETCDYQDCHAVALNKILEKEKAKLKKYNF